MGMFDTNPPAAEYVHSDCEPLGSWTNWAPGEPDLQSTEFCIRYTRLGYWRTRGCDQLYHFICERPLDSCWFDTRTGAELVGIGTVITNMTLASCRQLCRNDGDCTALTSFQDGTCFLQTDDIPHILTSPDMDTYESATTEIKRCVAYVVSDLDNNYMDDSDVPNNTCLPASSYLPASHLGTSQLTPLCAGDENQVQTSEREIDVSELRLDKSLLSNYKRRFYSVYDDRPSMAVIGSSGVGIICFVLATVICMDLERLARGVYTALYGSPRKIKVIHAKRRTP
ncbi:uncharacterized protein LOC124119041 [Haliotis rufescens]|uniref:uncharacterized protein LOC124119041 n=1 Tax=Haliotis rufescens TaxID=6454 RepID=UPI00201F38A5|nr:uncharacterized protein LOC124119041 [Haliotis rufescens]